MCSGNVCGFKLQVTMCAQDYVMSDYILLTMGYRYTVIQTNLKQHHNQWSIKTD